MDYTEKIKRCQEYVEALEQERRKIQVFHRELPLCLELVNQAIENCRKQMCFSENSECEEQTSSEGPVLEEFIPLKRSPSSEEEQSHKPNDKIGKKVDWLRSVQLWNQIPDPPLKEDLPREALAVDMKKIGGAFHPFQRDKGITTTTTTSVATTAPSSTAPTVTTSSTADTFDDGNGNRGLEEKGQLNRKARRCWSPELHKRFLHALQQLGGSDVATPKQIRELMKVDGLTNDEVKSHLQKYRLHTRRPGQAIHNISNPQPTQFVVVGGIWVPPPEYTMVAATTTGEATGVTANGLYTSVAAPPHPPLAACSKQQQKQKKQLHRSPSEGTSSESENSIADDRVHSSSETTSSSTDTTTASPAF